MKPIGLMTFSAERAAMATGPMLFMQFARPAVISGDNQRLRRLLETCGALYSITPIPKAVAPKSAIAIAVVIPTICLTVGMIHLRLAATTSYY